MSNNFQNDLRDIFNKHKEPIVKRIPPPIPEVIEEPKKLIPVTLYKIHKRSLPVSVDIPILFNLTHEEAKRWHTRLKPKLMKYVEDGIREVVYYDIVKDGVSYSMFDNDVEVVQGDKDA